MHKSHEKMAQIYADDGTCFQAELSQPLHDVQIVSVLLLPGSHAVIASGDPSHLHVVCGRAADDIGLVLCLVGEFGLCACCEEVVAPRVHPPDLHGKSSCTKLH